MIDTETANTHTDKDGKLNMSDALVYDCGLAVIDRKGSVYETDSLVNSDIFIHEQELMQSAYYARKIPQYHKDIADGSRRIVNTYEMRARVLELVEKYHIKHICAHNARFDVQALNNTQRWTTKSKYRYFLPYGVEVWDTMKMTQDTICRQPTFKKWCAENGFCTKQGVPRKTAEVLYRYITKDTEFTESHTGLEDVLIETAILAHCFRQHKKMRRVLYAAPIL